MREKSQKQIYDEEMQMATWEIVKLLDSIVFRVGLLIILSSFVLSITFVGFLLVV